MMMLSNIAFDGVLAITITALDNSVMVNVDDLNGVFGIGTMRMGNR
jgi:hypothetical protein